MKLIPINLPIEDDIAYLYSRITRIQKNAAIMGGYLSDLYMGTPYKDIDIFIRYNEKKNDKIDEAMIAMGYANVRKFEGKLSEYGFSFFTSTYTKNDKTIQLVFTNQGIRHVKFFDARLREFIYFKNQVYVSQEAIKDIENKQIVLGTSVDPMRAMIRAIHFSKRYQFSIEKESLQYFFKIFNKKNYQHYHLENIEDSEAKGIFYSWILPGSYPKGSLKIQTKEQKEEKEGTDFLEVVNANSYIDHFAFQTFEREVVEAIRHKTKEKQIVTFEVTPHDLEEIRINQIQRVQKELKRKRLFLITSDSDVYKEVEDFCLKGSRISEVAKSVLKEKEHYKNLYAAVDSYEAGMRWSKQMTSTFDVEVHHTLPFFPLHLTQCYAKGKLVNMKINKNSYVLYHKRARKMLKTNMETALNPWIEEILHVYEKKKAT